MKINKKLTAMALSVGVVGAGLAGSAAMAEPSSVQYPSIVDKLAEKFNLNKDEVKKVFDEQKAEHQVEHKQKLEEKLNQAVKDGKLSEDQKTKLLAKMEEMQKQREENRQQTKEQREAKRQEFKTWAEQNGINLDEVLPMPEGGPGHRPRH